MALADDLSKFARIANAAINSMTANSTAITSMTVGGAAINATSFAGTANNASNLGGVAAASYQLNSTLAANVATMAANSAAFANNATNLNGQAASFYTDIPSRLGYTPVNKAGDTMTGALTTTFARIVTSGVGEVGLSPGSNTNPGYIEFRTAEGTRRGYIGWNGGNVLQIQSENSWNYAFNQAPLIAGNVTLHAGNFNSYSPTLTGTGASGNWGINVTGNAATVTNGVYTTGDQTIAGTKNFNGSLRHIVSSGWSNFYLGGQFNSYLWMHMGGESTNNDLRFGRVNRSTLSWEANPFTMDMTNGIFFATGQSRAPIFYDSDDTTYYVNPNGGSQLQGHTRFGPYAGSTSSGNQTGVEIMNNGGTGDGNVAAISYHCQGAYGMHQHLRADGYFGIGGWSASAWRWYVFMGNGDMVAAGNVIAYSDPRLKEDITKIESPVEKLKKLNGMRFRWKQNSILGHPGEYDYGVLANEVQEVFPEIVADSMHDSPDGDRYKTVAYDKLVPVLIEAVKAQQNEIEELKTLVKALVESR